MSEKVHIMNWRVSLGWRDRTVLEGRATAAMAYQVVGEHARELTGPHVVGDKAPSLDSILAMADCDVFSGTRRDERLGDSLSWMIARDDR